MAGGSRQGINSLETGVRLFQELHRLGRPATLSELSKLSRMPPAKTHRYCVSLIRTGLMQQDARGLYAVGPFGFQFGHQRTDFELARQIAFAALPPLVRAINETAFLSEWAPSGPVILKIEESARPVSIRPNLRGSPPMWNSSSGRAFAAFLPRQEVEGVIEMQFVAQKQAEKLSAAQMTRRRRDFDRNLADARKYGIARSVGDLFPSLNAFSAPIFDRDARVILVLTSFGLTSSFPSTWDGKIPRALKQCAAELTARIGGRAPD